MAEGNGIFRRIAWGATTVAAIAAVIVLGMSLFGNAKVQPPPRLPPPVQIVELPPPPPPPPPPPEPEVPLPEEQPSPDEPESTPIEEPQPEPESTPDEPDDAEADKPPGDDAVNAAPEACSGPNCIIGRPGGTGGGTGSGGGGGGGYEALVQSRLARAIQNDRVLRTARFTIDAAIWIGSGGRVERVEIRGTSGNPEYDAAMLSLLQRASFDRDAPAGQQQPMRVRLNGRRPT
jgi:protein TonB